MALRPTQPAVLWVQGVSSLEVKQLICDADHTHACNTEVNGEFRNNLAPHMCLLGISRTRQLILYVKYDIASPVCHK
jgi:hypothetical protein